MKKCSRKFSGGVIGIILAGFILVEPIFAAELVVDASTEGNGKTSFRTIQEALNQAKAGDVVHVKPGVYQERVQFKTGGTKGQPVTLEGEPGAIIDGSDDVVLDWQPAPDIGPGVYRAALNFFPFTITVDGKVITTLNEKRTSPDGKEPKHNGWTAPQWPTAFKEGIGPSGWEGVKGLAMYQNQEKALLIRLKDQADPRKVQITVAQRKPCVEISGKDRCVVRGLILRNAATGVQIGKSFGSVVELCEIGPVDYGVKLETDSESCTIRFNDISYRPYCGADYRMPGQWDAWQACKMGGYYDRFGIHIFMTKGGHEIHDNYIHDAWDGIVTTDIVGNPPSHAGTEDTNKNMKIHHNYLYNVFDDGIETMSAMPNTQYYQNILNHCRCAFRIKAPTLGPIFSYKNFFLDNGEDYRNWNETSAKVPSDPRSLTAEVWLYHNTSTSNASVTMNYTPGFNSIITAQNYHYVNNLFWCRTWVGKNESFPLPDWKGDYNVFVKVTSENPRPWDKPMSPDEKDRMDKKWLEGIDLAAKSKLDGNSQWIADKAPGFSDAEAMNYALAKDSVARERGQDLSKVKASNSMPLPGCEPGYFKGVKPDVGAIQFGEAMLKVPRKRQDVDVVPAGNWP